MEMASLSFRIIFKQREFSHTKRKTKPPQTRSEQEVAKNMYVFMVTQRRYCNM